MRKIIIKKCLILVIISLFFGVGTIPSTIGIVAHHDIIKNNSINPFLLFLEQLIERFPTLEQIIQLIYVYLG